MNIHKIITASIALALSSSVALAVESKVDTLKFSSFLPASTVTNKYSVAEFIEQADTLSDGHLNIKLYAGGSLVSGGAVQLKMVQNGIADIAEIPLPYTPGRIKGMDVFELPNLAKNNSDGSIATLKLIENNLISGLDDLVVLGVMQAGPYYIHTREKIEKIRDLRGKKLRVSGHTQAQIVSRLGAVPISNIPATGLAENLSRGLIDGVLVDTGNLYNFGVGDLVHYHITNLPLGSFSILWAMSKEKYNQLSPASRNAIDQLRGEWFTKVLGKNMDDQTSNVTARLIETGKHYFVELSEKDLVHANKVLEHVVDGWVGSDQKKASILMDSRASLAK